MPVMGPYEVTDDDADRVYDKTLDFLQKEFGICVRMYPPSAWGNMEKERQEILGRFKACLKEVYQLDCDLGF